jgi:UDP-N-acetylmuramate: L-alanyl-gamma-D-glutamyl-meso-diaminopimelate ligase
MNVSLSQLEFKNLKSVHIIGICGTLMGSFAAYLKRQGIQVSGSDQNIYPPMSDVLERAGIKLLIGYQASNLAELGYRPDLIVIGNVISRTNPEASYAIENGYLYTSLPEAMEYLLLPARLNLVVAGTHGKTTTSSLLAHALNHLKQSPSYFIGGVSQDLPNSFEVNDTKRNPQYFVLEGDEYDTAFWDKVPKFNHYLPDHVILTSIEYDHADIYPDFDAVKRAFKGLLSRIRKDGQIIYCKDYPVIDELLAGEKIKAISYGVSKV